MSLLPPGRPEPPLPTSEVWKRLINSNIESQITLAWNEQTGSGSTAKLPTRAVTARDFMTYVVPSHTLSQDEQAAMHAANAEAATLEPVWRQSGHEGIIKETGCKIVGVWLDRPPFASQSKSGNVTPDGRQTPSKAGAMVLPKAVNGVHAASEIGRSESTPPSQTVVAGNTSSFGKHPTRHIALVFVYQGWHYSGLAIQQAATPLPTVEGELLKALEKVRLIEEGKGWEGCQFARCGRTDRGVSSAGQVVSLWIKSQRQPDDGGTPLNVGGDWRPASNPVAKKSLLDTPLDSPLSPGDKMAANITGGQLDQDISKLSPRRRERALARAEKAKATSTTPIEFAYPHILNRVLPPEIRVLGWSPLSRDPEQDDETDPPFDARFSCTTRHYRYFFNRNPIPNQPPLDIDRMQEAASLLVGEHDFRNFCKVDGSKQIENHSRRVLRAFIRPDDRSPLSNEDVSNPNKSMNARPSDDYVFELVGSAFLWHQVRHIMAILFHIGHRFESPELVTAMLNTGYSTTTPSSSDAIELPDKSVVANKPLYQMAAALPLQLYQCGYPEGTLDWRYHGYDGPVANGQTTSHDDDNHDAGRQSANMGSETLLSVLKSQAEEARVKARHIEAFYEEALRLNQLETCSTPTETTAFTLGAGEMKSARKYINVLDRPRGDSVEEQNQRWRQGKGETRRLRKLAEQQAPTPSE